MVFATLLGFVTKALNILSTKPLLTGMTELVRDGSEPQRLDSQPASTKSYSNRLLFFSAAEWAEPKTGSEAE